MSDGNSQAASPAATETTKKGIVAEVENKSAKAARIVEEWVADHLRNSPLSRATGAWNYVQSKLGELRDKIEKEL